jgi:serine/threonine-protein kinase
LKLDEAVELASQIAEGLAKAHKQEIAHRDIKPANIFITADNQVKILDFGLAKLAGQTRVTRTGTTLGTAAYMSPEQAKGKNVDHRTDIWSLGVVLYEILTGELPFKGEYDHAITYSIINEAPHPVTSLRSDTPRDLEKIVEKSLAKIPGDRYQHVRDILPELKSLKTQIGHNVMTRSIDDTDAVPSIAVLPFDNMSPDPENAYFGDGLAEELINALTHLKGLRVAARTSAFRFRGREIDIREIGRNLNVRTVLEGSVRKAGNRLRVTAQLINIENGYHLWSERYDREMEDIFALQDEITAAIVRQLEVKLTCKTGAPLVKRYTTNLDAYSLYLKAQHHLLKLTPEGWQESFELYQQAVELDPSFALPYVSLSSIHQSRCFWGDAAPRDAMPKSRAAAENALDLDDDLGIAHAAMAVIIWSYDWNWERAEREFKRASELEPTEPFNHISYSLFLSLQGRFEEAIAESRLGQKLDPLSSIITSWGSISLAAAGLYDEAIECLRYAVSLNPNDWQPYIHLTETYVHSSRIDDAKAVCARAVELSGGASIALTMMAVVYCLAGNTTQGDELLEKLTDRSRQMYVAPSFFTEIYLARGEHDKALEYLKEAVRVRDSWLVFMDMKPMQIRPTGPEVERVLAPVRHR